MKARLAILGIVLCAGSAWAGECWVTTSGNRDTGFGDALTAKRHAGILATLRQADAALKADATLNALPRVRYQTHLYIGTRQHLGAPKTGRATVHLHGPEAWAGRCGLKPWADTVHFMALEVALNDLTGLGVQSASGNDPLDTRFFYAPSQVGKRQGTPIYENDAGNRILVITHGNLPPFVPVTVGEYLDTWQARLKRERDEVRDTLSSVTNNPDWAAYVAELRKTDPKTAAELRQTMAETARLAQQGDPHDHEEWRELQRLRGALTQAELMQPVYLNAEALDRHRFAYARPDAPGATALVKLNPGLWAGTPGDSEVHTVSLQMLVQDGNRARTSGADRWLERVDLKPYRALLRGTKG